jgi:PTS system mannose-specific IIB component/fructoselysine and glucoselysine-specific PTS system IIB component
MGIVLFRIDERLIHGQVLLGWGRSLRSERYWVVDNDLAQSEWEQDLYRLTLDGEANARFLSVDQAREGLPALKAAPERTVLLTRSARAMADLARGGLLAGERVNVGGIHFRPGRTEVRSYIHLDDQDRAALRELGDEGALVTGRDLPETTPVPLEALLA